MLFIQNEQEQESPLEESISHWNNEYTQYYSN